MQRFQFYLLIDEVVIEPDGGSVLAVVGIVDLVEVRPVDRSQAHRARLAGGIDFASGEVERMQLVAGFPDDGDLRMGCRVVVDGHAIASLGDDFAIAGNDSAERTAAVAHTVGGELDRPPH